MAAIDGNWPLDPHWRSRVLHQCFGLIRVGSPEQENMLFVDVYRVYDPQHALMLWQRIIAETKEHFEGH
jgi:hypothetical protein